MAMALGWDVVVIMTRDPATGEAKGLAVVMMQGEWLDGSGYGSGDGSSDGSGSGGGRGSGDGSGDGRGRGRGRGRGSGYGSDYGRGSGSGHGDGHDSVPTIFSRSATEPSNESL